jgi:hypothetical protein
MTGQSPCYYPIGAAITLTREVRDMSIGELAAAAKLRVEEVINIERGVTDMPYSVVFTIACALKLRPSGLHAIAESLIAGSVFEVGAVPAVAPPKWRGKFPPRSDAG